jgi:hypothetical protein
MNITQINEARALATRVGAAREEQRQTIALQFPSVPMTTAQQYHASTFPGHENEVGALIDSGKEPYLILNEALEFGTHPFLAVYDIMIERQSVSGGKQGRYYNVLAVGLDLHEGLALFDPHTLIAWL